jgi:AcrR family transcriptional regulator
MRPGKRLTCPTRFRAPTHLAETPTCKTRRMARPRVVSKDAIIESALAIIDDAGLSSLTMRSIAGRLGVDAAALYYHFRNKEAVLDAVIEAAMGPTFELPLGASANLEGVTLEVATRYVEALLRHPNLVNLIAVRQRRLSFSIYEYFLGEMTVLGIPPEIQAPLVDAMEGFVIGWALFTMNQDHHPKNVPRSYRNLRVAWKADVLDSRERFLRVAQLVIHGLVSGAAENYTAPRDGRSVD